ncbi:DUF6299 family protein [Streptomyces luteogriseus]|uniref:DUF6299 family protein n=1 Tax=Streptomyces luteogriseus TaxID=68233 RepID=UPI0037BC596B
MPKSSERPDGKRDTPRTFPGRFHDDRLRVTGAGPRGRYEWKPQFHSFPVFVSSSVSQGVSTTRHGVGGTRAVCDGAEHRWVNTGQSVPGALMAGAAHVEATLMEQAVTAAAGAAVTAAPRLHAEVPLRALRRPHGPAHRPRAQRG